MGSTFPTFEQLEVITFTDISKQIQGLQRSANI